MSSADEPEASQSTAESQPTTPPSPPPPPPPPPVPVKDRKSDNPELDIQKLQSLPTEQQELFLLTFVTDLTRYVRALEADDCTALQFYLRKEIFQIINLAAPQPSRVIRNNLGQCLAHVFTHGDRKLLFETINDLVGVISGAKLKSDTETRAKHAAVVCLGDVYAAAGDSAIGLHQLSCTALLKLLRSSSNNAGLRAAIFTAIAKIVGIVQTSMDESIARDIWKQCRNHASSDKGPLVVATASQCLKALHKHTAYFQNSSDIDKLETAMFKAFDSPLAQIRHATASCLAQAYAKCYSDAGPSEPAKSKKTKTKLKRQSTHPAISVVDNDETPARTVSPAPGAKRKEDVALSLGDILGQLASYYVKPTTSNRSRAAIGVCYGKLFRLVGEDVIEPNYLVIVDTLTADILGNAFIANNRYRLLFSRRIIDTLLHDVIGNRILGESGQIKAAQVLINNILKNYPAALPERPEPSKQTLITALRAVAALIQSLGSATNKFAEACRDGLLQVFQHPSYSVQVFASQCMKIFTVACPQQLLPCLSVCINSLTRELSLLANGRNSQRRCIGLAHGLAATLSASPLRPLHGSLDINSRVLAMSTNLLKSSGQSELRVSRTQIQVAWILIGGLMSLGPNFVKIHLSQLLLLWKNALPKPLTKENTTSRSMLEASFLTHVRECALGSILAFLEFNNRLLTVDVSKRIATMLQSTTTFLKTLPTKKTTDDVSQRLTSAIQLQDLEKMVQRRVLQCYVKLVNQSPAGGSEALLQSNLLTLAISLFADPENYSANSLSASIANAAATYESIWDVDDNNGFGITGLVNGFRVRSLPGQHNSTMEGESKKPESPEQVIDSILLTPICGSLEHDASALYIGKPDLDEARPDPPATEVINAAIQLFAFAFPLTPGKVQESILEQVRTFGSTGSLQRDLARNAAISVNVATAILATMRVATKETASPPGDITNSAVETLLQDIVRDFVIDQDQYVRQLGYAATARLCNVYGNAFTNHEIKYLVDTIVDNREPSARAGCAMALGSIQTKVGGMAAGYHLKTILGILMSLCNDPHPTVHYWALEALSLAADAAGLSFAGYVPSTLGMLAQLFVSETHHAEIPSAITMALEVEMSTPAAIARCIDSVINVLGPDLQDSKKSREMILTLVGQFQESDDDLVKKAALMCLEHLSLYAPGQMNYVDYVGHLQAHLASENADLRDAAIDGIHNMMKRNPQDVLRYSKTGFEEKLWLLLDSVPEHDGIRNMLRNWMQQTCLTETSEWLDRLQKVLGLTRVKANVEAVVAKSSGGAVDLNDEEVAGFAAAAAETERAKDGKHGGALSWSTDAEPLRWQVTTFAIACIGDIFAMVAKDVAVNGESAAQVALQNKIADVVRMAFSASTSGVLELRIWGLKMIGAVLKMFGKVPDPDFEEAMLLEQYQAQISSALTPAFAADSSPELASEAVQVCASFISIGIVTDVERMGRILRTLVGALESFSTDDENASIGDLKGLSSNAQTMVKIAVFSAWAELQVASSEQKYLLQVLKPHIGKLTPLWLESLREFAQLRFEPDISMTLGPPSLSGSLDSIYAALNRETLLKFYQDAWLKLVDAIASLIEQDSDFVFDALDGKESSRPATTNGHERKTGINYRDEPVAFFFVLFGLAFESLAIRPGQYDSLASRHQTLAILQALKRILHPSVSGHAIYRPDVFAETMDLLDRLVLTEDIDVQTVIVDIARAMCVTHPSARRHGSAEEGDLSDDIDQLFELTRIIVLVLSGLLPNLAQGNSPVRHQINEETLVLIRTALESLVDAAEVFPYIIKSDLHACIMHIFATILSTPACQQLIVPQSLGTLKRFIGSMSASRKIAPDGTCITDVQLQASLRQFLAIYVEAQKREEPTSLVCVRNCLLATTILFTGGKNRLPATEPLVVRFLDELLDCLTDVMTTKIASSCIRSLLLQGSPTSPSDITIARYLVPRLIAFVTRPNSSGETEEEDPEGAARSSIAHSLCLYVGAAHVDDAQQQQQQQQQRAPAAMALVVPMLMARATAEGEPLYPETSARLLQLAALDQDAFRGVVAAMSTQQRALLEKVVRWGRQARSSHADHGSDSDAQGQPTIQLKMNFGD